MARKKATSRERPAKKSTGSAGKKRTAKKKASTKRAATSRKKTAKKAAAKGRKAKTVSKKTAAKKPSAKKAKKKAAGKKKTTKKAVSRKATTKKAATNKVAKKATAKKKGGKKKVTATKAAVKTKAKSVPKKAAAKPAVKKPSGKKAVGTKAPANRKPSPPRRRRVVNPDALIHGITPYSTAAGEEYMSDEQLEHFRDILKAWKRELMEEVDRTVHHMQDEASNFPDPNDRATQESEFGLELRTRDRERKLLKKIEQALQRIDDGSYGFCEETGEEIGLKRLEARPVATLCVEAQERRELAERQYRDRDDQYR